MAATQDTSPEYSDDVKATLAIYTYNIMGKKVTHKFNTVMFLKLSMNYESSYWLR